MRRLVVILTALIASVASSPSARNDDASEPSVSFELENQYAESIFKASWEVPGADEIDAFDGDATGSIADELRLDTFESEIIEDAFVAPAGTPILISLTGRSLGENHEFDVLEIAVPDDADESVLCRFEYDYDLANANFTVRHGCN